MSGSRRLLLKLSFVAAMVVVLLAYHPKPAHATCSGYGGTLGPGCSRSCYDQVYCEAIECFQQSWAQGGDGQECCFYNTSAQFCGSGCPLFCAE